MLRILLIVGFLFFAGQAGAQSLRPALRADTAARAPLPAYLLTPTGVAPGGYYQQHFGFFCKREWAWEKHTGLPVKVRLGNYQYAQQQEGK